MALIGVLTVGAAGDELVGDALLLATGRRPNVDRLGLEEAGVAYSSEGIQIPWP